jgi:GT2 family glycosyltransferase
LGDRSISVILPHYNRPDSVREAIASIHAQTLKPAEIVLVDDHSTVTNRAVLDELRGLATVLSTPKNMGAAAARNFGARQAKGRWLAFLDDDDCYLPRKLERQMQYLVAHPDVVALGGSLTMVSPDGREGTWGGTSTRRLTLADALLDVASMVQGLMIRRDVFLQLGGFDQRFRHYEDFEFGIRLLAAGHETHFLGEPLVRYRRGGRDQLSLQWRAMFRSELRIIDLHAHLARREFGALGAIRLKARCCRTQGVRRGRLLGRLVWALGSGAEAVFGRQRGIHDA